MGQNRDINTIMRPLIVVAAVLMMSWLSASTEAQTLTFGGANVATPGTVLLSNGNTGVPSTIQLWNPDMNLVNTVLVTQGYTNEYSWFTNSLTMANNTNFNVVNGAGNFGNGNPEIGYLLQSSGGNPSTNTKLDESMHVTLNVGATVAPVAGNGQTVTQHWLQLLNEDRPYPLPVPGPNNYGFTITGQPGYWQIDNGDTTNGTGAGANGSSPTPFYDIAFSGWSATEIGDDPSVLKDGQMGAYLQFYDIPVWDVQSANSDTVYLGSSGFKWGFTVVPEPTSLSLLLLAAPVMLRRPRRQTA